MRLSSACTMCGSIIWCGRPCKNANQASASETPAIAEIVNKATDQQTTATLINSNASHQAKWRQAHLELNRQRAREGMRKHRAKQKANAS